MNLYSPSSDDRFTDVHSWHIFTGIGVYIFMVLVECLGSVHDGKGDSKAKSLSSAGLWPFMVHLEKPYDGKKKN